MKTILHLLPDEKFIDYVIESFNNSETITNVFCVVSDDDLRFIKNKNRVELVNSKQLLNPSCFVKYPKINLVLIHGLKGAKLDFVNKSLLDTKFVWFSWGADFYGIHPKLRDKLYLSKTNKVSWKTETKFRVKRLLKPILNNLGIVTEEYLKQEQALRKIQYIAPVIYEDFLIIKKLYHNSEECQYLDFVYGDVKQFTANLTKLSGNNILIGNSASASNNHMELLDILKDFDLGKRDIFAPLSYGNEKYAKEIVKVGQKSLGDNFKPLRNFIPLEDYVGIISSCQIVIMNHLRQQGMGNIYAMLYLGARVYLRKENPAYDFFIRNKIKVYQIDDIKRDDAFLPLSEYDKKKNKKKINDLFSRDVVQGHIQKIMDLA